MFAVAYLGAKSPGSRIVAALRFAAVRDDGGTDDSSRPADILMLDLALAAAHHLTIFGLFGVLVAELILVREGMSRAAVTRVGKIDLWYGILAGLILAVGFSRAVFAAKGWGYYAHNGFFWAKIGTFLLIGLLSLPPTVAYIRWRRTDETPSPQGIAGIRRLLWAETALFLLLPVFAAAMARGYGAF